MQPGARRLPLQLPTMSKAQLSAKLVLMIISAAGRRCCCPELRGAGGGALKAWPAATRRSVAVVMS